MPDDEDPSSSCSPVLSTWDPSFFSLLCAALRRAQEAITQCKLQLQHLLLFISVNNLVLNT